ncbi:MAG: hypothetical protein HGA38_02280 [Candidatus Moranbacteria bacterium]|nr:hypothetical protein [Candidatus Moranbacteria bacterium]
MSVAQNGPEMESRLFQRITPAAAFRAYEMFGAMNVPFRTISVNFGPREFHILGRFGAGGPILLLSVPNERITGGSIQLFVCRTRLFTLDFRLEGDGLRFLINEIAFVETPDEIPPVPHDYRITNSELENLFADSVIDGCGIDESGREVRCSYLSQATDPPLTNVPYRVAIFDDFEGTFAIICHENTCRLLAAPKTLCTAYGMDQFDHDTIGSYLKILECNGFRYPEFYVIPEEKIDAKR